MLTILYGTDWTVNRDEILRRIAADVRNQRQGRILLVPELISHDMERRLAEAAGDHTSLFAEVLSFSRLARRIADQFGGVAHACMDGGGRVMAMAGAAYQLSDRLKSYASVETKPEFLTAMVDTVDEFKRCCITHRDLKLASQKSSGALAQKLEELSLLMEGYDAICSHGKMDPRDLMQWAIEQLEETDFAQQHTLYVDGFPDFSRQHMELLQHFIRVGADVTVSINCDHWPTGSLAFAQASQTAAALERFAKSVQQTVQVERICGQEHPLNLVCTSLFQGSTEQVLALDGHLQVLRCDSVRQECQVVAEKILQLLEQGYRYRDIAVVCGDMQAYRDVLQLVFRQCGIPLYLSGTEDILHSGVISTVMFALDAALDGFEQKDVLRYLRSVLSPLDADTCDLVENYAYIWAISGKQWSQEWTQHPDGLGGKDTSGARKRLALLESARKTVMEPLMRLRQGFRDAVFVKDQVITLYRFLEETGFAERLSAYCQQMEQEGQYRNAQILNQLWEIFISALEQLHDVLGDTCWQGAQFSRLLKLLLNQYNVGTIPAVLDAVMAGPVTAMRCQQEKFLFVLGAEEGCFPGFGGAMGVLTEQERIQLRSMDIILSDDGFSGMQTEFASIYGVFCGAQQRITVCCSGAQPSFVYRRLASLVGGEVGQASYLGAALVNEKASAALLAQYQERELAQQLGVLDAYLQTEAHSQYQIGRIQSETVHKLYGEQWNLSASQVDLHAQCRMAYFLKYGLQAKERKEATVDPAEFGTYVHAVLEETAKEVMAAGGFAQVSLEETVGIAMRHSAAYTQAHFSELSSKRMEYLFRRNIAELEMVVRELWRELHESAYQPIAFELDFSKEGQMPAIPIQGKLGSAVLRGFVDRVDVWEFAQSHYFRVVDYKTGKKDFDYCDVFNGIGLQMLLYLFALEDAGEAVLGDRRVSAGVQYFPARAPYMTADGALTDEEASAIREKEWKRRGLLLRDEASLVAMDPTANMQTLCCSKNHSGELTGDLADREQLAVLKQYVFSLLGRMVDEIAEGKVSANPYTRGSSHNACTYCPYGAICHQAQVSERRNYKAMKPAEFWNDVYREVKCHG